MRGVSVAKGVRRYVFSDAGFSNGSIDNILNTPSRHTVIAGFSIEKPKERSFLVDIHCQTPAQVNAKRHIPVFVAFAPSHMDGVAFKVNVPYVKRPDFVTAKTTTVQKPQQNSMLQQNRSLQKNFYFRFGKHNRQFMLTFQPGQFDDAVRHTFGPEQEPKSVHRVFEK